MVENVYYAKTCSIQSLQFLSSFVFHCTLIACVCRGASFSNFVYLISVVGFVSAVLLRRFSVGLASNFQCNTLNIEVSMSLRNFEFL